MGIDVSKAENVYCIIADGECLETGAEPNTPQGVGEIIKKSKKYKAYVVFEPTGGYERLLKEGLLKAGVRCSMADAYRIRLFARAVGIDKKNDRIDAETIARYACSVELRDLVRYSSAQRKLRDNFEMNRKCVSIRDNLDQDRPPLGSKAGIRFLDKMLRTFKDKEKFFLGECHRIITSDTQMAGLYNRFIRVKGVGEVLATAVLALVPEIGNLSDPQISKLVGVAPMESQSGKCLNVRHIGMGRAQVRSILYMAALSAVSSNRILKNYYDKKRREGHASNWCLIPVMRKMICLLNRMARNPGFVLADDSLRPSPKEPEKAGEAQGEGNALSETYGPRSATVMEKEKTVPVSDIKAGGVGKPRDV